MFDHRKSFDLRVADIEGNDMMTVIYPYENAGMILNNNYEVVKRVVYSSNFNYSNMHDFNVIANGERALVLTKETHKVIPEPWAESVGVDGGCSVRADGLKELDISGPETKVVFEWNGTDHIGADETTFRPHNFKKMCKSNWDIHHFNAIDQFPDGDYLLSSRHTSTLYKISHKTGEILWRLGGTKSDFDLALNVRFTRQHHARVHSQNSTHIVVSVFDNAKGTGNNEHASNDHSRGLIISLNLANKKANLVAAMHHPRGGITNSRGSNQILPDDNVFMCWAYHTLISEHAPDGRMLMEARLKKNIHTYRSYKYEWVGKPLTPPDVYATTYTAGDRTETYTYVSWNGATEVTGWNLYETDARGEQRKLIMHASKSGFETEMIHFGFPRYVVVEALDRNNRTIGKSEVFETVRPVEDAGKPRPDHRPSNTFESEDDYDESDPTIDFDMDDETYSVKPDSASWTTDDEWTVSEEAADIFASPVTTFITGFISCAVACGVFWAAWKYRTLPVFRPQLGSYAEVGKGFQGEGDEDESFVGGETLVEEHTREKV